MNNKNYIDSTYNSQENVQQNFSGNNEKVDNNFNDQNNSKGSLNDYNNKEPKTIYAMFKPDFATAAKTIKKNFVKNAHLIEKLNNDNNENCEKPSNDIDVIATTFFSLKEEISNWEEHKLRMDNMERAIPYLAEEWINIVFVSNDVYWGMRVNGNIINRTRVNQYHCNICYLFTEQDQDGRRLLANEMDKTLFIFKNMTWEYVVENLFSNKFQDEFFKFNISGGSHTKRHILSPLQYKFSLFLAAYRISKNNISISYNSINRNFTRIKSNKYTIGQPKNSRGYHTFLNKKIIKNFGIPRVLSTPSINKNIRYIRTKSIDNNLDINIQNILNKNEDLYNLQSSVMFTRIKEILHSENDSNSKQILIEEKIHQYNKTAFDELLKSPKLFYNKIGLKFLLETFKNIERDLQDIKKDRKQLSKKIYKQFIDNIDNSVIVSIVLSSVIPYIFKNIDSMGISTLSLYKKIGQKLIYTFLENEYTKYIEYYKDTTNKHTYKITINKIDMELNKDLKLSSFCNNILNNLKYIDETFYVKFGMDMVFFISIKSDLYLMENEFEYDKTKTILIPTEKLDKEISEYLSIDENIYPMISRPVDWNIDINKQGDVIVSEYGGFNLSEFKKESFIHKSYKNSGNIKFINDDIVKTINYLQSIEYTINKDVLFIILKYLSQGLLDDYIYIRQHPETPHYANIKINNTKKGLIKQIEKHNSKNYLDRMILSNSILYKNHSLFFPVFIDFRGRLYANTSNFSYQGNEMIKALLLYKNGVILNDKGLNSLKLYTANCYGYGKKSNSEKLLWVDNNIKKIIDLDNNFWLEGKDVLLCLAVSIELKNYYNNPSTFISRLPVYIDATCNGLQHLSSMINDVNLAKKVNIYKSTDIDVPEDVYTTMAFLIKQKIKELVKDKPEFSKLDLIKIDRSLIKRGIMTISYGVTKQGVKDQLISDFFNITDNVINNKRQFQLEKSFIDTSIQYDVFFDIADITKLSSIIHGVLFEQHINLSTFIGYLKNINKFLNKIDLNMGVVWKTPSGLIVEQKYCKKKPYTIKTRIARKQKSVTITKNLDNVDIIQQNNSIVPNIVHSMDAANISILVNNIIKTNKNIDISTIHDCFASQANNIEILAYEVKLAFLKLYKNQDFIDSYHNFIINYLKDLGYFIDVDNTYIYLDQERKIRIPVKPNFIADDYLCDCVLNSNYLVG